MLSYDYALRPTETELDGGSSARHPSREKQLQTIHESMERIGQGRKLQGHGTLL